VIALTQALVDMAASEQVAVTPGKTRTLDLHGFDLTLIGDHGNAGLGLPAWAALTITDTQTPGGTLTAMGGANVGVEATGAGIGTGGVVNLGEDAQAADSVTINGSVTVIANAGTSTDHIGSGGAGIGGGGGAGRRRYRMVRESVPEAPATWARADRRR
jgi:hypothetical protein